VNRAWPGRRPSGSAVGGDQGGDVLAGHHPGGRGAASAAERPPGALARLRHGPLGCLDASLTPAVQQILLIDGPAVPGWKQWRPLDERYGLGVLRTLLDLAIAEGTLPPQPVDALA
jgi:hypothetical protein